MYTTEEIMKMLDTKSEEDLVKEFTTSLNAAAKRKAEEEKAKAAATAKVKDADKVMAALTAFLSMHYPEWGKVTVTGKDLVEILDSTKVFTREFKMPSLGLDPISDFLKKHNL